MQSYTCTTETLNKDGYAIIGTGNKIPLFNQENKIQAILTIISHSTKTTPIRELYEHYKKAYKNNKKLGNRKFLEYLGIPLGAYTLTDREIECLISLSHKRLLKETAAELGIAEHTVESHLTSIRHKLNCQNLSKILIYFVTFTYRKF